MTFEVDSSMCRVQRTSAWNAREFGHEKWPAVESWIASALAAGEHDLARVVALTARRERELTGDALDTRSTCVMGTRMDLPAAVATAAHDALVVESVIAACREDTGLVIELGAGWGRNLAAVWLAGGPAVAWYVCAEVTESGRRVAQHVGSLAKEFDLHAIPYDFEHPRLERLPDVKHAVVFTCHGIGQVPILPDVAIESIGDVAPEVTCVHVEPIGWQMQADTERDTAQYAAQHDYNRNLWRVLESAQAAGRIVIDRVVVDALGGNPLHPSSLVVWHAARRLDAMPTIPDAPRSAQA